MLDATPIVQSAISSFNNAALFAPSFFWTAVLTLPLFWLVVMFRDALPVWVHKNHMVIVAAAMLGSLLLMPGNYAALRTAATFLPIGIAAVTFCLTAKLARVMPGPYTLLGNRKYKKLTILGILIAASALVGLVSGMPTLPGVLLQAAAVLCGFLIGRANFRTVNMGWIIFAMTTMILMQPEFFRFGQMGSLTIIHKFFIFGIGAMFMAMLALGNINARGKIRDSAFMKLKWAARIVSTLCVILFFLTESVPVFLGTCFILFMMFALSVWHAKSVPSKLSDRLWAITLCAFGIVTTMPVITAVGILKWMELPQADVRKQSKFLL